MFVHGARGEYTRGGEQRSEGRFLALFDDQNQNLWGIVRFVRLRQFGHFMMGDIRVGSQLICVSGTYGGDGLPISIEKIQEGNRHLLTPMPADLQEQFWKGGGHNSSGSEGPAVREWGRTIMKPIPKPRRW